MLDKIILAIIQAATEYLPVSSSGHLALVSNLISEPDIFFFTVLHLASLIAVVIFTRREIIGLLSFRSPYKKIWLYLIIATLPAAVFGFFFNKLIEQAFSSLLFIGTAFLFTGIILLLTRFSKEHAKLSLKNSLIIGLFQVLALLPGVSRSGITISSALFLGIEKERAARFSFLLFIPLSLGAFVLELGGKAYINAGIIVSFFVCLVLSIVFLNVLLLMVRKGKFWVFSIYCCIIGIVSIAAYCVKIIP